MNSVPTDSPQWQNWQLRREDNGLAWLEIDCAGAALNTLSQAVLAEFEQVLDELERTPPTALVIASGKAAGFIAGADIDEFSMLGSPAAVRSLVERGWQLCARLARVPYPTLALIRGHCLGGGLELALACRYRLAVAEAGTRLALPEVMLGIVPGWGGMLRLPATIGAPAALDMMLTGRSVSAPRARQLGLVDDCVPLRVAVDAARMLVRGEGRPRRRRWWQRLQQRLLNGPLRKQVATRARQETAKKVARRHYPAPYAVIDIWQHHDGNPLAVPPGSPAALETLFESATTKNLLRVFSLQERLKAFGKDGDFSPRHVHVVGAGVMGGDIAALCALHGMRVTLQDQSVEQIAPAIARAAQFFARRRKEDARAQRFALDRLVPDVAGAGVAHADVVIEAISENLAAKRALFGAIEARARADAVLATNTSSLRVEDIAAGLDQPERLVGIHFFNPVAQLPLVEVVRGRESDERMLARATGFVRALDKLPLPVKSAPGFLVNAVLGPYMLEALRCVEEGRSAEGVDAALLDFGMAIGPVELVDTVGLDIALAAGTALAGPDAKVPQRLQELVAAGKLGRKSGEGYYRWKTGRAEKKTDVRVDPALAQRILAPLLAAARACVDDGVVADADLADAGLIFGAGYAPWTGGPLHAAGDHEQNPSGAAAGQQEDAAEQKNEQTKNEE